MATLNALNFFEVVTGGRVISGGSRSGYKQFTVGVPLFDETKTLSTGTTWDAWGFSTEEPLSAFQYAFILSDLSGVMIELTTDKAGTYGTQVFTLGLIANVPQTLCSNVSYANYSADFGGGTLSVINRLRINNPSALAASANVRVALFN